MTLIAEKPALRTVEAGATFATPTIVHFSAVLLLSALTRAPWQALTVVAILWALIGLSGVAYVLLAARRMRAQTTYRPQFEDWLCQILLPLAAYAMLAVSALMAAFYIREALFGVGAAALLLLFVGIHNSWDSIAYQVFNKRRG